MGIKLTKDEIKGLQQNVTVYSALTTRLRVFILENKESFYEVQRSGMTLPLFDSNSILPGACYQLTTEYVPPLEPEEYVIRPIHITDDGYKCDTCGIIKGGAEEKCIDLLTRYPAFCGVQFEGQRDDNAWYYLLRAFVGKHGSVSTFTFCSPGDDGKEAVPVRARFLVKADSGV